MFHQYECGVTIMLGGEIKCYCGNPGLHISVPYVVSSVKKPHAVNHVECAASLKSGVKAYSGLFYQARVQPRSIVMIFSAASVST